MGVDGREGRIEIRQSLARLRVYDGLWSLAGLGIQKLSSVDLLSLTMAGRVVSIMIMETFCLFFCNRLQMSTVARNDNNNVSDGARMSVKLRAPYPADSPAAGITQIHIGPESQSRSLS